MSMSPTTASHPQFGASDPKVPLWRRSGFGRFSAVELLVTLVLLIALSPFFSETKHGSLVESLLISIVLILATMTVGSRRWTFAVAIILVVPTLVARWLHHLNPGPLREEIYAASGLIFVLFAVGNLFHFILRAPKVDLEVVCAGISGYLLLGIVWVLAYNIVWVHDPKAFAFTVTSPTGDVMQGFTAMYFSYVTLCTVGYGDIVPVTPAARMLASVEAMTGTFYMAIMIARLVSLYSSRKSNA